MANQTDPIQFVFNELSARVLADTEEQGRLWMDDIVDALGAVMAGRPAQLNSVASPSIWEANLAVGYSVSDWWGASDRDRKGLFGRVAEKTELPDEVQEALKERFYCSEFLTTDEPSGNGTTDARGLGAAYLLDGIGVSLPSERQWGHLTIALRHLWLDDDCREREESIEAMNLSQAAQAVALTDLLALRQRQSLTSAPLALARRKAECFPHLSFGLDVDGQIERLPSGILRVVIGKLATLDAASREWRRQTTMIFPRLPKCHLESSKTMQQFGSYRVFRDCQGTPQCYEPHCMVGSAYRIHLRVVQDSRTLEIGYIGQHLPTATDPH